MCGVPSRGKVIVVDGHRIYNMLDAIPLGYATGDDIGTGLTKNGENGGKLSMLVELDGRNLRRVGVPSGVAMQFRTGSIEHRCPVDSRIGRQHRALLRCVAPLLHEQTDIRNVVSLGQAVATPAIDADDEDVFCLGFRLL